MQCRALLVVQVYFFSYFRHEVSCTRIPLPHMVIWTQSFFKKEKSVWAPPPPPPICDFFMGSSSFVSIISEFSHMFGQALAQWRAFSLAVARSSRLHSFSRSGHLSRCCMVCFSWVARHHGISPPLTTHPAPPPSPLLQVILNLYYNIKYKSRRCCILISNDMI